jgi:hypothetical protein
MADTLHHLQLNQPVSEHPQGPAHAPLWWLLASQRDQMGFLHSCQFPFLRTIRLAAAFDCCGQAVLQKACTHSPHCAFDSSKGFLDLLI